MISLPRATARTIMKRVTQKHSYLMRKTDLPILEKINSVGKPVQKTLN